jgi:hypothetical protein
VLPEYTNQHQHRRTIMNKLQSFLAENRALAQPVEPRDQAAVEGGGAGSVTGDDGGCIPKHLPQRPLPWPKPILL